MNRNEMLTHLLSGVCQVVFTKINGETRNMRCTLVRDMIPTDQTPTSSLEENVQPSQDIIRVFDLTANGWRSFKVDNVTSFEIE
jgi:hypothetical protein